MKKKVKKMKKIRTPIQARIYIIYKHFLLQKSTIYINKKEMCKILNVNSKHLLRHIDIHTCSLLFSKPNFYFKSVSTVEPIEVESEPVNGGFFICGFGNNTGN